MNAAKERPIVRAAAIVAILAVIIASNIGSGLDSLSVKGEARAVAAYNDMLAVLHCNSGKCYLSIFNLSLASEDKLIARKEVDSDALDIAFSPDGNYIAVLKPGRLTLYNLNSLSRMPDEVGLPFHGIRVSWLGSGSSGLLVVWGDRGLETFKTSSVSKKITIKLLDKTLYSTLTPGGEKARIISVHSTSSFTSALVDNGQSRILLVVSGGDGDQIGRLININVTRLASARMVLDAAMHESCVYVLSVGSNTSSLGTLESYAVTPSPLNIMYDIEEVSNIRVKGYRLALSSNGSILAVVNDGKATLYRASSDCRLTRLASVSTGAKHVSISEGRVPIVYRDNIVKLLSPSPNASCSVITRTVTRSVTVTVTVTVRGSLTSDQFIVFASLPAAAIILASLMLLSRR